MSAPSTPGDRPISKRRNYNHSDLPAGVMPKWGQIYVPTLLEFVGSLENPWKLSQPQLIAEQQSIWDRVFPELAPIEITDKHPVFFVVRTFFFRFQDLFLLTLLVVPTGDV